MLGEVRPSSQGWRWPKYRLVAENAISDLIEPDMARGFGRHCLCPSMIPKKPALGLDPTVGTGFRKNIMLGQQAGAR
jgi:hypothetical protein